MENSSDQKQEKPQHLVGLFKDQSSAAKAYHVLTGLDYSSDKITFVISEEKYKSDQMVTKTVETIPQDAQSGPDNEGDEYMKSTRGIEGFAIGTTAGAVLGTIALVGASIILPGAGILFPGPLAAAATGAGAGATVGGMFGALIGSGHPEETVDQYVAQVREGNILIGINPRTFDEAMLIERQWTDLGGAVTHH